MTTHPLGSEHTNVFLTQGNEPGVDPHHAHSSTDLIPGNSGVLDSSLDLGGIGEHVSQSTRLHHKMREMKEMDDALALMKSDYADRIRAVKDGESKFLIKQHNIIKYLRRFKLFILESDTKRARAEKKEAEEHRQRNLKIKEIEALRAQFLQLQQTRSDLKQKNDHYKQNKSYLESVKDAVPDQYGEIDELIVRHQILKQTNTDLNESNRLVSEKMESISAELQQLYKTKQNDILVKNSKFASLLQKLEQVTNETSSIENEVEAMEIRTRDMNRYFCEVQMAIQNIYARTMSSLPSAKAASQMKKRMQQQAVASKEAAAANGSANDDLLNTPSSAATSSLISQPASRLGSATGVYLDSDLSDEDLDLNSNQTQHAPTSYADEAAQRAATMAANRSMQLKQQSVKQHLLSRLAAIMERLEDLQDIVEYIQPGALQILREGGSIYSAPNLNLLGAGGGGGGSGGVSVSNTERIRANRRPGGPSASGANLNSPSKMSGSTDQHSDSSSRRALTAASSQQVPKRGDSRKQLNEQSPSPVETTLEPRSVSPHAFNKPKLSSEEMERRFRQINENLVATGFLGEKPKHIPADQVARAKAVRHSIINNLPAVKGATSGRSPRTGGSSPRQRRQSTIATN